MIHAATHLSWFWVAFAFNVGIYLGRWAECVDRRRRKQRGYDW